MGWRLALRGLLTGRPVQGSTGALVLVCGLALACTWPGRLAASEPTSDERSSAPEVVVLPAHAAHDETPATVVRAVGVSLRASLTHSEKVSIVLADLLRRVETGESLHHHRKGEEPGSERLEEARTLYRNLQLGRAIEVLRMLRDELEADLSGRAGGVLLARALLLLAIAEHADGDPVAESTFDAYARMRPEKELSPADYPPAVLKAVAHAREAVAGKASLRVEVSPPGARVELDGLARGEAPLELAGVPSGRHRVRVLAPGHLPRALIVELPAAGEERVVVELEVDPAARGLVVIWSLVGSGAHARRVAPVVGRLATDLGVDAVVLPVVQQIPGGYLVSALLVRAGEDAEHLRLASTTVDAGLVEIGPAMALLAAALLAAKGSTGVDARPAGGLAPALPPLSIDAPLLALDVGSSSEAPAPRGTPVFAKWWFWTAALVVVAGGTVGVLAAGGVFAPRINVGLTLPEWPP